MSKLKILVLAFFMLYLTNSDAVVKQSTMQSRIIIVDNCLSVAKKNLITVSCKGNSPFTVTNTDDNRVSVTY